MNTSTGRSTIFTLWLALSSAACGSSLAVETSPGEMVPATAAEMEAIFQARSDSALLRVSPADVDFMTRMIGHHAQALEMSALAPERTGSAQIRTLADRIINAQTDEIATMAAWLRDRQRPVPPIADGGSTPPSMQHHAVGGMDMPGMVSPDQMRALEQASGEAFDRLFLTLMIQHHLGAVEMVADLFDTDGAAQDEEVFKFASDAQADQGSEVARMERMLADLDR